MGRAVKNPSLIKKQWIAMRNSLLELGSEGKEELSRIEDAYKPRQLFAIEKQSPVAKQSIVEMLKAIRTARDDIIRGQQIAKRQERQLAKKALAEGRPVRRVKVRGKGKVVREGSVEGIRYRIRRVPIHDDQGQKVGWGFKIQILKTGRIIKPMRGAPKLYTHPDTFKIFPARDVRVTVAGKQTVMTGLDAAEIAARRIINAAVIWYAEHGVRIAEKKRMTKRRRARHEAIQTTRKSAREKSRLEAIEEGLEARRAKKRKEERAVAKKGIKTKKPTVRGVQKGLGRIEADVFGKTFKTPKKALKGNPLGFGSSVYVKQAEKSARKYKEELSRWERSMSTARPKYKSLMSAYDWLENVRANLSLDEQKDAARRVQQKKEELRDVIVALMEGGEIYEAEYSIRNPAGAKKKSKKKRAKKSRKKKCPRLGSTPSNSSKVRSRRQCSKALLSPIDGMTRWRRSKPIERASNRLLRNTRIKASSRRPRYVRAFESLHAITRRSRDK